MQVQATYKYARISAFKVREVTREIQGKPVSLALDLLAFTPKKAAGLVGKTLKSAVANAENNEELNVDTLVIKEAIVGEGPTIKRFRPRARGSASAIRKRMSHITITLTDEIEIPAPRVKKSVKKKKAALATKAAAKTKPQPASEPVAAPAKPEAEKAADSSEDTEK